MATPKGVLLMGSSRRSGTGQTVLVRKCDGLMQLLAQRDLMMMTSTRFKINIHSLSHPKTKKNKIWAKDKIKLQWSPLYAVHSLRWEEGVVGPRGEGTLISSTTLMLGFQTYSVLYLMCTRITLSFWQIFVSNL